EGFVSGSPFIQICLGAPGGTPASPRAVLAMLDHLPANCHWSAFGFGAQSFPMVAQAFLLGGHVRVGLEDNVHIREGTLAAGNAELVEHAARIVRDLGGTLASAQTARRLLGLI
ncbi:MAG TPA: 3-keto-5-aminohexanoate cleavage protein, partial [Rhizomicrobium sp.]